MNDPMTIRSDIWQALLLLPLLFCPQSGFAAPQESASGPEHGVFFMLTLMLLGVILLGWFFHIRMIRRLIRRHDAIYQKLPLRTGVVDAKGNILFWHSGAVSDRKLPHLRTLADLPEIDPELFREKFQQVFDRGEPLSFEYTAGAGRRTLTAAPVATEVFGVPAVSWVSHDINELVEARSSLADARRRETESRVILQALLDNLPVAVLVKNADDDFRYFLCNPAYCRMTGRTAAELLGKNDRETGLFPGQEERLQMIDARTIEANRVNQTVEVLHFPHSGQRVVERSKIPLLLPDGRRMLLITYQDITKITNFIESERVVNDSLAQMVLDDDFQNNIDYVFAALIKQLKSDRVTLLIHDQETGRYRLAAQQLGNAAPYTFDNVLETFCAMLDESLRANRLTTVSDVPGSPYCDILRAGGLHSFIAAPIFTGNQLYGAILVGFIARRRYLTDIDEGIVCSTANILALAAIRSRQSEEIRRADREKQMILNNIRIPIWLYDAAGRLLRVNTAACALAGLPEAEVLQQPDEALRDGEDVSCPVRNALLTGQSARQEVSIGDREFIVSAEPILDADGRIVNVVKNAVDVTELNELNRNEQVLNSCLEILMKEGDVPGAIDRVLEIIGKHMDGDYCYIQLYERRRKSMCFEYEYSRPGRNRLRQYFPRQPLLRSELWYRMLSSHREINLSDIASIEGRKILGEWGAQLVRRNCRSLFASGIFVDGVLRAAFGLIYDGSRRNLSESCVNFLRGSTHLFELLLQRLKSREQLLAALKQAQDADKAKSFFLASMSHEIRTPLNSVIGFAELLRQPGMDETTRNDYLDSIASSGNALLEMINDVLDLSKLEANQMVFKAEKTDFLRLAADVAKIFKPRITEKSLGFRLAIEAMPKIYIDKLRIRQILFNLIGNAVKFTPQGTVTLSAIFLAGPDYRGELEFSVTDTGIGIDQEDQKRLFEPFVQSKAMRGTYAANSGTGLGLVICRRMLEKMNGDIRLTSTPGRGSTFTVTLHAVNYEDETHPDALAGAAETPVLTGDRRKILLVDDVRMNLKVLEALCRRLKVDTVSTESGLEALARLSEEKFDLVLTDLWMPGMNGAELARAIRRQHPELPVAALTADVESRNNFELDAFDSILTKPVTSAQLGDLLHALVRRRT